MTWGAFFGGSVFLHAVSACCSAPPPLDVGRLQAEITAPASGMTIPPRAEHRGGGGVEVLVFSPLDTAGDFRDASDAERVGFLRALAPGLPSTCGPGKKELSARVWSVVDGAFSRPGVAETLAVVRLERCGVPDDATSLVGLFDVAGRLVFQHSLPRQTMVVRATDPFGEGRRSLVLSTSTGNAADKRLTASFVRMEGDRFTTVAVSAPMDTRCRSAASAGWFFAVLRPGRPPEFQTAKAEARCER
jgi:hypothetical protein